MTMNKYEMFWVRWLLDNVRKDIVEHDLDNDVAEKFTTHRNHPNGLNNPNTPKVELKKAINEDIRQINELLIKIYDGDGDEFTYEPDKDATVVPEKTLGAENAPPA